MFRAGSVVPARAEFLSVHASERHVVLSAYREDMLWLRDLDESVTVYMHDERCDKPTGCRDVMKS